MAYARANGVSFKFQVTTSIITALVIFFLLFKAENRFCSIENAPIIHKDDIFKNGVKVSTGLTIEDFSEFNVVGNNFIFFGTIWFEFDPNKITLEKIKDFTFEHGEILSKSEPMVQKISQTLERALFNIKVSFKAKLDHRNFPFDDHKIFIILANKSNLQNPIVYESSKNNFKVSENMSLANWKLINSSVEFGYDSLKLQNKDKIEEIHYPQVSFELDFARTGFRYTFIILLPLLFIFFLEMLSFVVSHGEEGFHSALIQVSVADIAALFAYRFVIEMISPQVGYFMISDYLFFIFLGNSFIVYNINNLGLYLSKFQKTLISIFLQLTVIVLVFYFLNIWMVCK